MCLTCLDRGGGFEPLGLELRPGEVEGLREQVEAPHVEQQLLHPPIDRERNDVISFPQKPKQTKYCEYDISWGQNSNLDIGAASADSAPAAPSAPCRLATAVTSSESTESGPAVLHLATWKRWKHVHFNEIRIDRNQISCTALAQL